MTAPEDDARAYAWPAATGDQIKLFEHHAADQLRQFALDIFPGRGDHELVNLGQVRAMARCHADRLDGCDAHPWGDPTGLPCLGRGPDHTHRFAASDATDRHDATEGVQA